MLSSSRKKYISKREDDFFMGHTKKKKRKTTTQELVIDALFIAMTFAFTWLINIRLPLAGSGGLIHLGNVPLFIAAMLFGRKSGFLAGAFGMGLFDLMSGWAAWAPFTFIIVGCMGFVVGLISEKKPFRHMAANDILSVLLALVIKITGYYFAEVILTGNWAAPIGSIPGNVLQVGIAGIVVLALIPQLRKLVRHTGLKNAALDTVK